MKCVLNSKCPEILYSKVSDKWHMQTMQTQIKRNSLIRIYTACYSAMYFKKQRYKKWNLGNKKSMK